ncbi:MAG: LiaF domain-containing protein [Prevotella sp.]
MTRVIIGLVLLVWGATKLLTMTGIWDFAWLYAQPWTDYVLPSCALILGLKLLSMNGCHKNPQWNTKRLPAPDADGRMRLSVSMGGDDYSFAGESFYGADVEAFMGGIRLDLRQAKVNNDVTLKVHTFMGGVELYVPDNVNITVSSSSFIGGVDNKASRTHNPNVPTISINAQNFIGGVSIKN